jgi:hypothetical protein
VADSPADSEQLTADEPTGVRHVLVNGVPIRFDGIENSSVRSGQLIKFAQRDRTLRDSRAKQLTTLATVAGPCYRQLCRIIA